MPTYLIVAHQTAESEELLEQARALTGRHPDAQFTLLVPATPPASLLVWEEGTITEIAERQVGVARERLAAAGIKVTEARVGDADPFLAVDDELRRQPDYAGVLVSTLPPGISRWLRMDLISRIDRLCKDKEVMHVVAAPRERTTAHK